LLAGREPVGVRVELVVGEVGAIGVAHGAWAAIDGDDLAVVVDAEVVVVEEEGIVGELVGECAGPVLAEAAGGLAVAVPDGADADLAGSVGEGGGDGVGDGRGDDTALTGVGAEAIGGVDLDIGLDPALAVVEDGDGAEGDLTVGPVEEELGGTLEVIVEAVEEEQVVAGVPLDGDVEVKDEERVSGGDDEGLDAGFGDGVGVEAGGRGGGAGIVEGVGIGVGDGEQGDQLVADPQFSTSLQVAQQVRAVRSAGAVGDWCPA